MKTSVEIDFNHEVDPEDQIYYACREKDKKYVYFFSDNGYGGGGVFAHPSCLNGTVLFQSKQQLEKTMGKAIWAYVDKSKCRIVKIIAKLGYVQV